MGENTLLCVLYISLYHNSYVYGILYSEIHGFNWLVCDYVIDHHTEPVKALMIMVHYTPPINDLFILVREITVYYIINISYDINDKLLTAGYFTTTMKSEQF